MASAGLLASPARADGLLTTHRLSAVLAAEAATEVVASCARQGYAETAVVVDADGVRQAVLHGDRAGSHTLDSANDKAYTAASFKADTGVLVERAKTAPGFSALFTQLPHLVCLVAGSSLRWAMRWLVPSARPVHLAQIWMRPVRVPVSTRSVTS